MTHALAVLGTGLVDPRTPVLLADDLGLQRGDGCFETMLAVRDPSGQARPVRLDAHLARLARSSQAMDLPPVPAQQWRDLASEVLAAWTGVGEATLKLTLTRGVPDASGMPQVTGLASVGPVLDAVRRQRETGVRVVTLSAGRTRDGLDGAPWLLGSCKTLSYAVNMAVLREAARRGVDDAVLVSTDGWVLEAPTASVLWWRDGVLHTTPEAGGILPGTTQAALFAAAASAGTPTSADFARADDLATAEAVWLVSSVRGLTPVLELDGSPLATRPDLTARLAPVALGADAVRSATDRDDDGRVDGGLETSTPRRLDVSTPV